MTKEQFKKIKSIRDTIDAMENNLNNLSMVREKDFEWVEVYSYRSNKPVARILIPLEKRESLVNYLTDMSNEINIKAEDEFNKL